MAADLQKQWRTHRNLPHLPPRSNTPSSNKTPQLLSPKIKESNSKFSQDIENSPDRIFSRYEPQNDDDDKDKSDAVKSFKRERRHSLHLVDATKEKSMSFKSVPNNMHLIPPKTPKSISSYTGYSRIGDNEDLEEEEEEEDVVININYINDTTTDASKKRDRFHRIRNINVSQFDVEDIDNKHDGTTQLSNDESMKSKISSKYGIRDELALQRRIINISSSSEGDTERDESEYDDQALPKHCIKPKTLQRNSTIKGFQFYINLRNILSLLTLTAIGISQFVYYRYYFLCGVLTMITCLFYIILLIPSIYHNLYKSYWYSFVLVIIRLFHIINILSIFAGVETCFFHYQQSMQSIESIQNDHFLNILTGLLYGFITTSMIICYFQNIYVIKYDENMVLKWKLFYCCKGQYFMNEDGSWRGDQHPISGCDGLFTFVLFITTFSAIIVSVVCINKMEFIIY